MTAGGAAGLDGPASDALLKLGRSLTTWTVVPLLLLGACSCGAPAGPATSSNPGVPAPAATRTPTAAPATASAPPGPSGTAGSPPASENWTTYTTAAGDLTFDLPSTWRVRDPAGELAEGGGAFAEVTTGDGRLMATLRTNMATGSTCIEKYPYAVLDSQEMPQLAQPGWVPRYMFETRGNTIAPGPPDTPAAAYGITALPLPEGASTCYIFHFFAWPPNSAMFGAFYDPDINLTPGDPALPYLEKARLYSGTAEYRAIRRMITSLRPAG